MLTAANRASGSDLPQISVSTREGIARTRVERESKTVILAEIAYRCKRFANSGSASNRDFGNLETRNDVTIGTQSLGSIHEIVFRPSGQ